MADAGLTLYRIAAGLGAPLTGLLVRNRLGRGKEIPERVQERFGRASRSRPDGQVIWFHAASVGEVMSILPLLESVGKQRPGLNILLTTGTVTSAELVARRVPGMVIHQFVPFDVSAHLERFLETWRPSAAFFVESEIWPNTIQALNARGIPMVLVNARMSEGSARRWRLVGSSIRELLGAFDLCLAQSEADAERLRRLGARNVSVTGNLKIDVPAPPADAEELRRLRQCLKGRSVLTAASTHRGEDAAIAEAHGRIQERTPGHLSIIVPRHPERGEQIAALLREKGIACQLRSQKKALDGAASIYIPDTVGELGLWYRLSQSVFMGGSLIRHGGQNPIEPAKLKRAVLHGPHVGNFAEIYGNLDSTGGARQVESAATLAEAVIELANAPAARDAMARRAAECVSAMGGALKKTFAAIGPYLPEAAE